MGLNIRKAEQPSGPITDPHRPPRDYHDRPLVLLPDGSKRAPYGRPSGAGGALEDTSGLTLWKSRLAAYGAVTTFPELAAELSRMESLDDPAAKKRANEITSIFQEAAGMSLKAEMGTIIHALTEAEDRGEDLGYLPEKTRSLMEKYRELIARLERDHGYRVLSTETFGVNDELKLAGTSDRISEYEGEVIVVDNKSSGSLDFGVGKFAMQMLAYAGMVRYDDVAARQGEDVGLGVGRTPMVEGREVSRTRAAIIWIPQSGETAQFGLVNLEEAVVGYELAAGVREWRNKWKRKALKFTPIVAV